MIRITWTIATVSGPVVGQADAQTMPEALQAMTAGVRDGYGDSWTPSHAEALQRTLRLLPNEVTEPARIAAPGMVVELRSHP